MIDTGYIYAKDNSRIFINTCLGCTGKCSYCYLPKIGYDNKEIVDKILTMEEILSIIKDNNYNLNKDTLITLGCYSECLDERNKKETLRLIEYFLKRGNQIQLSTKKEVQKSDFENINKLIKYPGQLLIFVSIATIRLHSKMEKGTDCPEIRFKSFGNLKNLNIPIILYLKPVLENISYNDIDLYIKYIERYNINDVVIGSVFKKEKTKEKVHFSDKAKLFYNPNFDEDKFINNLKDICNVFRRSTEVTKFYKK